MGERELCQVLRLPQVVRVYAGGGKVLPVMADPLVGVAQHGPHAPELQGVQFIQTGRLDRFAPIRVAHSSSSRCYSLTNALIGTRRNRGCPITMRRQGAPSLMPKQIVRGRDSYPCGRP